MRLRHLAFAAAIAGATAATVAARRRLQPVTAGTILHGGGSGEEDFRPYFTFMDIAAGSSSSSLAPILYMTYLGLDSLNNTQNGTVNQWFTDLNSTLAAYGPSDTIFLVPQIGLSLPHNGGEEKVANGSYDNAIAAFVNGLAALAPRPAYIRIGYEANGPWK